MKSHGVVLILWTSKDRDEARRISTALLEKRLIACASMAPVESIFRWEGKIEESQECKVFLKTTGGRFEEIKQFILNACSYEVPEILQVSVEQGNPSYLSWVQKETQ